MQATLSRLALALIAALGLSQCAIGYNGQWQEAYAAAHKPYSDITGAWIGTWRSEGNGHHGELKCVVTRVNQATGECRFHYRATFLGTLSAMYDVSHLVKGTKDGFQFSGDQTLKGMGGGLYHYEGHATPTAFHATYRSSFDHGVFEMARPERP